MTGDEDLLTIQQTHTVSVLSPLEAEALTTSAEETLRGVLLGEHNPQNEEAGTLAVYCQGKPIGFVAWSRDADVVGLEPEVQVVEAILAEYQEAWSQSFSRAAALLAARGQWKYLALPDVALGQFTLVFPDFDGQQYLRQAARSE